MPIELRSFFACVGILSSATVLACSSTSPPAQSDTPDSGTPDASTSEDAAPNDTSDAGELDVMVKAVDCATYCATAMKNCNPIGQGYPNQPNCMAYCSALPVGTTGDNLDTVSCRQAHALAAASNAFAECPMAGPFPNGACGSPCDSFCALATAACGDQWGGQCASACAQWADNGSTGALETTTGNTLNCRRYYVERVYEHAGQSIDAGETCASVGSQSAQCQ